MQGPGVPPADSASGLPAQKYCFLCGFAELPVSALAQTRCDRTQAGNGKPIESTLPARKMAASNLRTKSETVSIRRIPKQSLGLRLDAAKIHPQILRTRHNCLVQGKKGITVRRLQRWKVSGDKYKRPTRIFTGRYRSPVRNGRCLDSQVQHWGEFRRWVKGGVDVGEG